MLQAEGTMTCVGCGEERAFALGWTGDTYHMAGMVFPIDDGYKVELYRRRAPAMCFECWYAREPVQTAADGEESEED